MDRSELLSTYAEYLLSRPIPESPEKAEGGAVGGMSAEEWEFRKQELELKKHSLPKMGLDPIEFPSYFASVENLFSLYEVPPQLQSKLLIPMLNERSKSLLAKLPKSDWIST